jgi:hypothetical protein
MRMEEEFFPKGEMRTWIGNILDGEIKNSKIFSD